MNGRRWFGFNRFAVVAMVLAAGMSARAKGQDYQGQGQMPPDPNQVQGQVDQGQGQDPPDRVGRISFLQGDVSVQPGSPNGDAAFAAAEMNFPTQTGTGCTRGRPGWRRWRATTWRCGLGG